LRKALQKIDDAFTTFTVEGFDPSIGARSETLRDMN